jgi:hypothetical protein
MKMGWEGEAGSGALQLGDPAFETGDQAVLAFVGVEGSHQPLLPAVQPGSLLLQAWARPS